MTDKEYIQKLKREIVELRLTTYHESTVKYLLCRIHNLEAQLAKLKEKYNDV